MRYRTILADPPWRYGKWGRGSEKSCFPPQKNFDIALPYPSLSISEICSLPVSSIADESCDLYLWVTQRYLPVAFSVMDAWGFRYCQALTWCKTPRGIGQGGLFCPTTEFLLLGRKGKMPVAKRRIDTTWWHIKRTRRHSQKPEEFQDVIETVSDAPRLELFARRKRPSWDAWGNEVECDVML